jgi:cytidylate kinase
MQELSKTAEVIAVDGPAGAGKSTTARLVARRLGWTYVDTGAMYRALCLKALQAGVDVEDDNALAQLARNTSIVFESVRNSDRILLDGIEVTEELRSPRVSAHVSQMAAQPAARAELSRLQRELALRGKAVLDGRDIGTHVVPEAELKIFLTAAFAERVSRRYRELVSRGFDVTREEVAASLAARDRIDSGRTVAPLRPAPDAVMIDTTELGICQVVQHVVGIHRKLREAAP